MHCSHDGKGLIRLSIGARTMMQKILYFLGVSAREGGSATHPTDAIVCAGRVGRGLTKGGGSLVGADDSHKVSR